MTNGSRSSEHSDVSEKFLTPTDVKQYIFCPRVTFFTRVMRLRPIMGSQQEAGKKSHDKLTILEERRKSLLKSNMSFDIKSKKFDINLLSNRLGVKGRLDMLLITKDKEYIPVEFKDMYSRRGNVHLDHKYQLVLLALLVEDAFYTITKRGILHYIRGDETINVQITHRMKNRAKKYLQRISRMIESGVMPDIRRECINNRVGCGYADQCIDY